MNAVKMRSTLSSGGAQLGHFATTFGAVMMRTSLSVFVVEGDLHLGAATLRFDGRVKKRSAAPQQTAVSQVLSTRGKCLVGPRHLSSSTSRNSGASVRSVARRLNSSAR